MNQISSEHLACAIVVTYHPDESARHHLQQLFLQFPLVVIVDNGSTSDFQQFLTDLSSTSTNVLVHLNDENIGLAAALNIGVELGLSNDATLIHTFDQDSIVDPAYAESMQRIYNECGDQKVIVGCNYWNAHKKRPLVTADKLAPSRKWINAKTVITSGMTLSAEIYRNIGPFDNSYFIDSIDHEYCLRAKKQGVSIRLNVELLITQTIGISDHENTNRFRRFSYQHSTIRIYYKSRNALLTIKKYFLSEPIWCCKHLGGLCLELVEIIIHERHPVQKLKHFTLGIYHGLLDRRGAFISDHQ